MSDPWAPPPSGPPPGPPYAAPSGAASGAAPSGAAPYGAAPYGAPPPRRERREGLSGWSIALIAATVVAVVGVFAASTVLGTIRDERRQAREAARIEAAYVRAGGRALALPPEPLGEGRRYAARAPWPDAHAFTLAGPRGWEARSVGEWVGEGRYYDTLLTHPVTGATAMVTRLRFAVPPGYGDPAGYLRAGLEHEADVLRGSVTPVDVGGSEAALAGAVALDGAEHGRIVLFAHGGEVFRVDVRSPREHGRVWDDVREMLAGIRWG